MEATGVLQCFTAIKATEDQIVILVMVAGEVMTGGMDMVEEDIKT